ncbi:hypothetical protein J2X36_005054 [Methylobacterium sp. BE186]|nr:hypothetical protein [Methylobacterium sp. BE186]
MLPLPMSPRSGACRARPAPRGRGSSPSPPRPSCIPGPGARRAGSGRWRGRSRAGWPRSSTTRHVVGRRGRCARPTPRPSWMDRRWRFAAPARPHAHAGAPPRLAAGAGSGRGGGHAATPRDAAAAARKFNEARPPCRRGGAWGPRVGSEQRKAIRQSSFRIGELTSVEMPSPVDCLVRDESGTGALIQVATTDGIPGRFRLTVASNNLDKQCEVVRRTAHAIGVRYVDHG